MKEIKFRAWDTENELMIYQNNDYYAFCIRESSIDVASEDTGDWIKCEIMQYTGLKDKNGKEIYEGDIVKGYIPEMANEPERKGLVKWGLYGWIVDFKLPKYKTGIGIVGFCSFYNYEVIGNIHTNPELLEVSE